MSYWKYHVRLLQIGYMKLKVMQEMMRVKADLISLKATRSTKSMVLEEKIKQYLILQAKIAKEETRIKSRGKKRAGLIDLIAIKIYRWCTTNVGI